MTQTTHLPGHIRDAQQRLLSLEAHSELDDTNFTAEDDIEDVTWLACVAILLDDDGLDGNTIVVRNQTSILSARASGFEPYELAQFAAMKEREAL